MDVGYTWKYTAVVFTMTFTAQKNSQAVPLQAWTLITG